MKATFRITTSDWREAIFSFIAGCVLLLVLFLLPYAPGYVRYPVSVFFSICILWGLISAVRRRWQESKTTKSFFGYYARLVGIGVLIVITWVVFVVITDRIFVK